MTKKITLLSKLSRYRKEYVCELLKDPEVKTIEVNAKKGIIVNFDENEYFIVLDNLENDPSDYHSEEEDEEIDDEGPELNEQGIEY